MLSTAPSALSRSPYWECIAACGRCALQCNYCTAACLRELESDHMLRCIAETMDCAEVCKLAASLLSRESPHARHFCEICARVCESCAHECEKHEAVHCQDCVESCRHCAQLCRELIA